MSVLEMEKDVAAASWLILKEIAKAKDDRTLLELMSRIEAKAIEGICNYR